MFISVSSAVEIVMVHSIYNVAENRILAKTSVPLSVVYPTLKESPFNVTHNNFRACICARQIAIILCLQKIENFMTTRKLCCRKDDRAMRPVYGCRENLRGSLTTVQ